MLLTKHEGETFTNTTVYISGQAFIRCTFVACTLVLRESVYHLEGCTFERCNWHVDRVLMIFFDMFDRFAQRTMQGWIVRQILAHTVADPVELALDDTFFRLASGREQHVTIACRQAFFAVRDRVRGQAQAPGNRVGGGTNGLVSGMAREEKSNDRYYEPNERGDDGPGCDSKDGRNEHNASPCGASIVKGKTSAAR